MRFLPLKHWQVSVGSQQHRYIKNKPGDTPKRARMGEHPESCPGAQQSRHKMARQTPQPHHTHAAVDPQKGQASALNSTHPSQIQNFNQSLPTPCRHWATTGVGKQFKFCPPCTMAKSQSGHARPWAQPSPHSSLSPFTAGRHTAHTKDSHRVPDTGDQGRVRFWATWYSSYIRSLLKTEAAIVANTYRQTGKRRRHRNMFQTKEQSKSLPQNLN